MILDAVGVESAGSRVTATSSPLTTLGVTPDVVEATSDARDSEIEVDGVVSMVSALPSCNCSVTLPDPTEVIIPNTRSGLLPLGCAEAIPSAASKAIVAADSVAPTFRTLLFHFTMLCASFGARLRTPRG
ncbi:MAG TPA: hypothetical protein VHV57_11150 [Acidimicrobiales bacterium]|nr:hypothetical protein [Acidimicrobiales bacterium]